MFFGARIDGDNIVLPARGYGGNTSPLEFPVDLLEKIVALDRHAVSRLKDAVRFYQIIDGGKREHYWSQVKDLLGKDLEGYSVIYYESNWEDSQWDTFELPKKFVEESYSDYPDHQDLPASIYRITDVFGDEYGYGFDANENVLVVKLDNYAEVYERIKVRNEENARYDAEMEALDAAED
jgi:hypothetical protein